MAGRDRWISDRPDREEYIPPGFRRQVPSCNPVPFSTVQTSPTPLSSSDSTSRTSLCPSVDLGYEFCCEFAFLGCNVTFHPNHVDSYLLHTASHFIQYPPPRNTCCIFCDRVYEASNDRKDRESSWRERGRHIADHFRTGSQPQDMRPDFFVIEYGWKKGLLSDEDYNWAVKYTEKPACDGLVDLGYKPREKGGRDARQHRREGKRRWKVSQISNQGHDRLVVEEVTTAYRAKSSSLQVNESMLGNVVEDSSTWLPERKNGASESTGSCEKKNKRIGLESKINSEENTVHEKRLRKIRELRHAIFAQRSEIRRRLAVATTQSAVFQALERLESRSKAADNVPRLAMRESNTIPTENVRKVLPIMIKTKKYAACPDSGSEKNIMREEVAIEQKLDIRRRKKDVKPFELGNGKVVFSAGRVRVKVQVPGLPLRRSKLWFYIFKCCPVKLVMGMNFLSEEKILNKNRHVLEECPWDMRDISSLLWIGAPTDDTSLLSQPKNRLKCSLDGRCLVAVADTGSDLNLMSTACAEREGFKVDTQPKSRIRVQFGDESQGDTVGKVYVYHLTLDWRQPETRPTRRTPREADRQTDSIVNMAAPCEQDKQGIMESSDSGAVFHVLPELPCDVIFGRDLLEKLDAFNACPELLSPKPRGKAKAFEYNMLIRLGPWAKKLPGFRSRGQSNTLPPGSKEAHDDERHDEMYRRSEKEAEIASLPPARRAQEEAREKRRVREWNATHVNCVHCNPA